MARRGENIRKRKDGRWEGRYICGRKENNKAIWGYIYGHTYTAVKQELSRKKTQYAYCTLTAEAASFSDLADRWFCSVQASVKASTAAHYCYTLDRYILPVLGSFSVRQLTETKVEVACRKSYPHPKSVTNHWLHNGARVLDAGAAHLPVRLPSARYAAAVHRVSASQPAHAAGTRNQCQRATRYRKLCCMQPHP